MQTSEFQMNGAQHDSKPQQKSEPLIEYNDDQERTLNGHLVLLSNDFINNQSKFGNPADGKTLSFNNTRDTNI